MNRGSMSWTSNVLLDSIQSAFAAHSHLHACALSSLCIHIYTQRTTEVRLARHTAHWTALPNST